MLTAVQIELLISLMKTKGIAFAIEDCGNAAAALDALNIMLAKQVAFELAHAADAAKV